MENDGEVTCNACSNKRLNRSDLLCWRCGGRNLDREKVSSMFSYSEPPPREINTLYKPKLPQSF